MPRVTRRDFLSAVGNGISVAATASLIAGSVDAREGTTGQSDVIESIGKHIRPLTHPLGDRLPILTWQSREFPTGLDDGRLSEVQQLLLDRGLSSLCNPVATIEKAKEYLPLLKYRQTHGFPLCILPQGWLQVSFLPRQLKGGPRPPIEVIEDVPSTPARRKDKTPTASEGENVPCPAAFQETRTLERGAAKTREVVSFLRDRGIKLDLLLVDFESGAYLRNSDESEESVRRQLSVSQKCPHCMAAFTSDELSTPGGYAKIVDESRAAATRKVICDPAREVYPHVRIGNYYAWPINRLPRPEGRWPAYGYEGSGMNVAMPRVYMNAGWGGAGRDQAKMNWNAFFCCLDGFSPAASVLHNGERLIPWLHVWLGGRYLDFVMGGRKLPEPWVMNEMACHMMLRGAETFAIWMDTPNKFPEDYPYPQYADMGQYVYDVKGVQEGFDAMLPFHSFLRRARPMTFDVPGQRNELGTAVWSGVAADDKALIRTVAFTENGSAARRIVRAYNRSVELTFASRGSNYWVYPDGKVEPIATK